MKAPTSLASSTIKDNQTKSPSMISKSKINEDNNNIKMKINPYDTLKKNKTFNQTFTNNIRRTSYRKNKKLNLDLQNINNGINVNIILCVTKRDNKKINKEENIPKTSPYTFKYFCNTANKKSFGRALSENKRPKGINQEVESNFMKLSKEANIYTANAEYIQNKKLLLVDKYDFKDNKYKPNRAHLFDMTSIPHSKNKINTLYKTTNFRGGRMFFFDNKKPSSSNESKSSNNIINNNKKPLYIQDLEKFELRTQNEFYKRNKDFKYIDNSYQSKKRHPPSNSLYKDLTSKKNEIYDAFINNKSIESENIYNPLFKSILTQSQNMDEEKENNKKNAKNEDLNGYSNLLFKKKNDGIIPITFPLVCSNAVNCDSISQRKRFENIMETFVRLKSLIENDKKLGKNNEIDYIIEFLLNKKIEKNYINSRCVNNFSNFLKCKKLPIDTSKSLKENIILALNYDRNIIDITINENVNNTNTNDINKKINLEEKKIPIVIMNNIFNSKPLEFDLKRQKRLFREKSYKNNYELRDSLKKELDMIDNEVENKQIKIKKIEDNLNLLPFEDNYYFKKNMNRKSKLKKSKNKELILISPQGYYKAIVPKAHKINKIKKNKIKENLFDSNERLYYTWYKNKNSGEIDNYIRKSKLTEYIIYNRTKDKIIKNKLKEIAEGKKNS